MPIDPPTYRLLTFDCYGTLVDWERGILGSVRPMLEAHGVRRPAAEILDVYARLESAAEKPPYRSYAEVLRDVVSGMGAIWGFRPTDEERSCLAAGLSRWEPFDDTVEALRTLHGRYRLAVISNVDDDLFASTASKLKVAFDWVTTAAQARAYNPDPAIFRLALERLGVERGRILHVAQSVHHDLVPARELGLATVWVRRPSLAGEFGVSLPAEGAPDAIVSDLSGLVSVLGLD